MASKKAISGFVAGDDLELDVSEPNVPAGQALVKAWFTVKKLITDLDSAAIVKKIVTTTNLIGTGQITDDGSGDGVGAIRFDLLPADTALLVPKSPTTPFLFDVQYITDAGKTYTSVTGTIAATAQVTLATS